ncbi:TPA: hypothetical protein DF272_02900 [Candidatus Falkowbacteria bacterium]|nr:hypothetical protein [Candidatus Falkowbacteria bacterium]
MATDEPELTAARGHTGIEMLVFTRHAGLKAFDLARTEVPQTVTLPRTELAVGAVCVRVAPAVIRAPALAVDRERIAGVIPAQTAAALAVGGADEAVVQAGRLLRLDRHARTVAHDGDHHEREEQACENLAHVVPFPG